MERRSLLDDDMTQRRASASANVFDDEYEVDEFDGVADGFRPSDHDRDGGEEVEEQPIRTVSAHYATSPVSPMIPSGRPSRNSTRKSRSHENPFVSPEDGEERAPSLSFEPADHFAHRSVSSASSHNFAQTGSPRFGAGPSHPYGMYPQGTIARSPSIATQSTIRPPQRQSSVRGGPQHPYTLYPQGVDEGSDDDDDPTPQNPVPIGFPGLGQSYRRQVGPEGEEQDIIGEDGHTEQLPPYTRYPEDGPEKMPLLVPEAPVPLHSRAPVAGTDPTMALMHTPIQPQPVPRQQSMTDQSSLVRHPSMASVELMHSNSGQDSLASKKSWKEKSWKEKRKTKVCGIPFWWILLSVCVACFIAIVLGGVIGGFVENVKAHHKPPGTYPRTSLLDASAIATPTSGSPATGSFQLALSTPQQVQAACLPTVGQQVAWSCDLAGSPAQAISVGQAPNAGSSGAFIFYADDDDSLNYGAQASFMQTNFSSFITVQDNEAVADGPAYYFQAFYDKLVVLPETALTAPSTNNKKRQQGIQLDQGWLQQKTAAQPGDKPWFCVWNNTLLEGFIYVQKPAASSTSLTTASAQSTTAPSYSSPMPTTSMTPIMTGPVGGSPTDIITTTFTMPSTTGVWTGQLSAYSIWSSYAAQHDQDSGGNPNKRQTYEEGLYDTLQKYPYLVKIEERRLSGNTVTPYCQQYQVLNDGAYNWVQGPDGGPIIITLDEQDPGYAAYESAGIAGRRGKEKRLVPGGCHCQWVSG